MSNWLSYTSYSLCYDGAAMTDEETEFLLAVASYQKQFHRRYPTWLEVLHILRSLGYRKVADPQQLALPAPPTKGKGRRRAPQAKGEAGTPATTGELGTPVTG